jgi:hypothetical protein
VYLLAARSFWYHVTTGTEVPVDPSGDLCLPLFDKPKLFGLHEEMLDEARQLYTDVADHLLFSLAVRNGWTLVDAGHNRNFCQVFAPAECNARDAVGRLQLHSDPAFIRVKIVDEGLGEIRTAGEIHGWRICAFAEGTPLSALLQAD